MATNKAILGTKLGMTQVFDDDGRVLPVTVVKAGPCPVVQVRTADRDGYAAVQIGFGEANKTNKPLSGHFARAGVEPTKRLMEVQLDGEHTPGDVITVDLFTVGEYVDVTGKNWREEADRLRAVYAARIDPRGLSPSDSIGGIEIHGPSTYPGAERFPSERQVYS